MRSCPEMRAWRVSGDLVCRFIFTGSVGVNWLLEKHYLVTRMNDCHEYVLDQFTLTDSQDMLSSVADAEGWTLTKQLNDVIATRVGWRSPYFMNLLLSKTIEAAEDRVDEGVGREGIIEQADIDAGYHQLVSESSRFSHWNTRLKDALSVEERELCLRVLAIIAKVDNGIDSAGLRRRTSKLEPDAVKRRERITALLTRLQDEGYVSAPDEKGRIQFLSFLLRDYWRRNHV